MRPGSGPLCGYRGRVHQNPRNPDSVRQLDIAPAVADHRAPLKIELVLGKGTPDHPRLGLPALTAFIIMRAEIEAVDPCLIGLHDPHDLGIHRVDRINLCSKNPRATPD